MTDAASERVYIGTPVTGGVAIGPLYILDQTPDQDRSPAIPFDDALAMATREIERLIEAHDTDAGEILEFQLALLEDDDLIDPIRAAISAGTRSDIAWASAMDCEIAEYRDTDDTVFSARADDLGDLRDRLLRALHGVAADAKMVPDGAILIAHDLTPSAFLELDWSRLGGAATRGGSPSSHVSILARARGVPLMVGTRELHDPPAHTRAVLDLNAGRLVVDPSDETLVMAKAAIAEAAVDARADDAVAARPARSADGVPIEVLVNIDAPSILDGLDPACCDGVGLTRTEFLFHDQIPGEEAQFAFYRRLVEWAGGRPVTIRTLDAGGDKPIDGVTVDDESNPFLGVRGVRISLNWPDLFRVQLRALARAAVLGPLKIMIPMVTVPDELDRVRALLAEEVANLGGSGVECAMPPVGIMVEVPAAALTAATFDADFYSIGTNDLIQYTAAAGRDVAALTGLADASLPAVYKLIDATVEAGRQRGVSVSVCGDMASRADRIEPLLRHGVRSLSCAPAQVGAVKRTIGNSVVKAL